MDSRSRWQYDVCTSYIGSLVPAILLTSRNPSIQDLMDQGCDLCYSSSHCPLWLFSRTFLTSSSSSLHKSYLHPVSASPIHLQLLSIDLTIQSSRQSLDCGLAHGSSSFDCSLTQSYEMTFLADFDLSISCLARTVLYSFGYIRDAWGMAALV